MKQPFNFKLKTAFAVTLFFAVPVFSQTNLLPGYPDRSPSLDVLPGFINPPKGYGEVPFYWWQGDTLTRERIEWQLNELQNKGISSLQINYSHLDSGGISYGLSRPSKPALFTNEWWDLFKWFAAEAQKRNMTVSLSDYTLGVGQSFAMDEALKEFPDMNGTELNAEFDTLSGKINIKLPEELLNVTACKLNPDHSIDTQSRKNLTSLVKNGILIYDFGNEKWQLTNVYKNHIVPSYDPMHPQSGFAYNKYFFDRFEKALPPESAHALNFFFSDELNFRLNGTIWNEKFANEFIKRKGYDVVPFLDALFSYIGDETVKIRLDYNDVAVKLSEENFFIPVYEWHQKRGLIFGCDHGGRGRDVAEFGDYFRTQRWNQGPGSDQPQLSKDIIKAKVAASISHLYNRPRVWLEGFHSSGWGTSSADVTDGIFANYVAGYNLMSFHGLYYSTHGSWWEWAPPDNHFRMPYWKQMDPLMNCIERLSYVLSQGHHVCDVAVIYPTEPVIAGIDGKKSVRVAFETGNLLYNNGIDFDFIDFESIARAIAQNRKLSVSGENYKILVVPSMKTIRYSTLQKLKEFKNAGGIIVNIGDLPESSEKNGGNDKVLSNLVNSIFSEGENVIKCATGSEVPAAISGKYLPNFRMLTDSTEQPFVMHRKIGTRDVFALYNFQCGSTCFFKAKGNVQLWNPWNGEIKSLSDFAMETADGTEITLPLSNKEIQLIVFNPTVENQSAEISKILQPVSIKMIQVDNQWEFEIQPSLDNKWGDFQLPANNEMMGAHVRQVYWKENADYNGGEIKIDNTWKQVTLGFGTQFLNLGPLAELPEETDLLKLIPSNLYNPVAVDGKNYSWKKYSFSWQQGVEGDYGHQGYHGLKGEMYDNFIRLGAIKEQKHSFKRIPEETGNYYLMYTNVLAPFNGDYQLLSGDEKPAFLFVNGKKTNLDHHSVSLHKGTNAVMAMYNNACETYLLFRNPKIECPEKQPISMSWYNDKGVLPFDCSPVTRAKSGLFTFESAPGLQSFSFAAFGKITCWVDGKQIEPVAGKELPDGSTNYTVNIKNSKLNTSRVILKIEYQPGFTSGAAIPQYFKQQCGKAEIALGDWSLKDGLKAYSGGAWYRKTIHLNKDDLTGKLEIDLGDLVSSAELFMNGKSAGIRLAPPWKFDITEMVKPGENKIEILIYNTLSNNFTAVPTRYKGSSKSGLIGPVCIEQQIF